MIYQCDITQVRQKLGKLLHFYVFFLIKYDSIDHLNRKIIICDSFDYLNGRDCVISKKSYF